MIGADTDPGLSLAVLRFVRYLQGRRRGHDIEVSLTQLSALHTLAECGPMTPTQLADRECVQSPSMTRLLIKLDQLGLVVRRPHPTDGRQMIVALTEAGERVVASDQEQWLDHQLDGLSPDDRAILDRAALILNGIRLGGSISDRASAEATRM